MINGPIDLTDTNSNKLSLIPKPEMNMFMIEAQNRREKINEKMKEIEEKEEIIENTQKENDRNAHIQNLHDLVKKFSSSSPPPKPCVHVSPSNNIYYPVNTPQPPTSMFFSYPPPTNPTMTNPMLATTYPPSTNPNFFSPTNPNPMLGSYPPPTNPNFIPTNSMVFPPTSTNFIPTNSMVFPPTNPMLVSTHPMLNGIGGSMTMSGVYSNSQVILPPLPRNKKNTNIILPPLPRNSKQ
jgi:hypothetical protein